LPFEKFGIFNVRIVRMTENKNIAPPYKVGVDIPQSESREVWDFVVSRGRDIFKDTAFVTNEKFQPRDISALKQYYQEVFDYQEKMLGPDGAVFNSSLREHLLLSERVAREMAPILNLDENLLDALILVHDFGRIFSHRRGRNDAIGRVLEDKLGFNKSFVDLLPTDTLWTNTDENSFKEILNEMSNNNGGITGVIVLVDVMGKWENKSVGILRKYEDVTPLTKARQNQPNADTMWLSELKRQREITSELGDKTIAMKYDFLKDWFEQKAGMKINEFIGQVEQSLNKEPIKESWV